MKMAIFTSKCPCCNAELQLDDDWIGKKGLCPFCLEHFIINKNNGYTQTAGRTQQSYVNDSYDLKEDEFVLQYLKASKTWNFIYHLLLAVALVVVGIILCCDDKEEAGIFCFLSLLPLINAYFLIEVLLSWFRGVYRNLLQ